MTKAQQKKILVIKLSALGDFIQSLSPMKAIRTHHPDAHITLLTTKSFQSFGQECGHFDEIVLDERPKAINIKGWLTLRKRLNTIAPDRVYDLQNNDRTNFYLKLFSKTPEWVGAAKGASHRNSSPDRTKGHALDGHRQTLKLAGIDNFPIDDMSWMTSDISQFELPKKFALFVTGCAPQHPEKKWPQQHYLALAEELLTQNITPILIGGPSEESLNQNIKKQNSKIIDLTSKTSFHDIVTLARNATYAIGNDTGPMHLIGASGCQTIALYNTLKSDPNRHYVIGDNTTILSAEGLENLSPKEVLSHLTL